ncbi:CBO0543 family protein [Cytobacillus praedii]|uniref:CBO0543 family protein n=1 Tax=Cytobacillus praedii TaxID=1742358 RepID=UPI00070C2629|nr:CBO0543 family protein [Cytobacillus praedii]
MNRYENLESINSLEIKAFQLDLDGWLKNELFTWEWWVLVAFFILPWIIWAILADKTKLLESTLFGTLVIIATTFLDAAGLELEFWKYPVQLVPIAPKAIAFDMSMVPVAFMLLHQYFVNRKSFIIALLITSAIYAFIGEPLSNWLGLVQYDKWKYIYSFFYYVIIGLIIRWLIIKLKKLQNG